MGKEKKHESKSAKSNSHDHGKANKDRKEKKEEKKDKKGKEKKGEKKKSNKHEKEKERLPVDNPISQDDYFIKSPEFRCWLKTVKGRPFEDLTPKESHDIFKNEFVKDYNKVRLFPNSFKHFLYIINIFRYLLIRGN